MITETALSKAFAKAGVVSPEKRVEDAARNAVKTSNGNFTVARNLLLSGLSDDAPALMVLFEKYTDLAAGEMITKVFNQDQKKIKVAGYTRSAKNAGGQTNDAPQQVTASGSNSPQGEGEKANTALSTNATAPSPQPSIAKIFADAILERPTDLGKPLGDCDKTDLITLSKRRARSAWFFDAVQSMMPPAGVVRTYFDESDLATLERRALEVVK